MYVLRGERTVAGTPARRGCASEYHPAPSSAARAPCLPSSKENFSSPRLGRAEPFRAVVCSIPIWEQNWLSVSLTERQPIAQ